MVCPECEEVLSLYMVATREDMKCYEEETEIIYECDECDTYIAVYLKPVKVITKERGRE